jgi:hypothetical protein
LQAQLRILCQKLLREEMSKLSQNEKKNFQSLVAEKRVFHFYPENTKIWQKKYKISDHSQCSNIRLLRKVPLPKGGYGILDKSMRAIKRNAGFSLCFFCCAVV